MSACQELRDKLGRVEIPELIEVLANCILEQRLIIDGVADRLGTSATSLIEDVYRDLDSTRNEIVAGVNADIVAATGVINKHTSSVKDEIQNSLGVGEDTVKGVVDKAQGRTSEQLGEVEKSISRNVDSAQRNINRNIDDVKTELGNVEGRLSGKIDGVIGAVSERIGLAETNILEGIGSQISSALGPLGGILEGIGNVVGNALVVVGNTVGSTVRAARDFVSQSITAARDFVDKSIEQSGEFVGGLTEDLTTAWTSAGLFIDALPAKLGEEVLKWAEPAWKNLGDGAVDIASLISQKTGRLLKCQYADFDEFVADMSQFPGGDPITRIAMNVLIGAGAVLVGAPTAAGPYLECVANLARSETRSTNIDAGVVGLLLARGLIDNDRGREEAARLGLTEERMARYRDAAKPLIDMSTIIRADYLGLLSSEQATGFAARLGFSADDYAIQRSAAKSLIDPSRAIHANWRGVWDKNQTETEIAKSGFTTEQIAAIRETNRPHLDRTEIRDAFLRKQIDVREHDGLLAAMGFTSQDAKLIRDIYFFIPPPSDLIRMSVRDVFSPEIAQRFGLFDEFPDTFTQWANQQGISEFWAKMYWGAHWSLPSPQQGFAMFQRRIITNEELNDLLKAQDLTPFWRDKMRDLAFNPLTRVDTRRMYETGVIDRNEVFESYLDQGYSPANAERLTKFTESFGVSDEESVKVEERELSRSVIERAYARNLIKKEDAVTQLVSLRYNRQAAELLLRIVDYDNADRITQAERDSLMQQTIGLIKKAYRDRALGREEARAQLSGMGFTSEETDLMLSLEDYRIQVERKEIVTNETREAYITFIIDDIQALALLNRNDFTDSEARELLEFWRFGRQFRTRKPTYSQLRKMVLQGLLTLSDWENELRSLGYAEKYIRLLTISEFGEGTQ